MCFDYKVSMIIMLCQFKEKNVEKSANYIDVNNLKYFTIKKLNEKLEEGLCIRNFEVFHKQSKTSINIMHLQLLCWEDHTALNSNYFEKIIYLINSIQKNKNNKPVIVHCSAGVGRTGTFICIYNLFREILKQINTNENEIKCSILNLVRKIKEMRMNSVENVNQFGLLYDFVDYILTKYNTKK